MNSNDGLAEFLELLQFQKISSLLFGLALIIIVGKFLKSLSSRLGESAPNYRLQFLQVTTILTFLLYILGTFGLLFGVLKPSKELLIAIGGSAAVAIGFSLKDLVGSIVAGVTLLFDRPFQVGDRVSFSGTYGEITNIGLRAVRLQTLDDNEVTIPNAKFMSEMVSSGNSGALDMMVVCVFHIDITSDIAKAKRLIYQVVATSRFVFLKKPIKVLVAETYENHQPILKISAKAYVFDVRYEKDFESDVYERGTAMLARHEISRPQWIRPTESPES